MANLGKLIKDRGSKGVGLNVVFVSETGLWKPEDKGLSSETVIKEKN